MFCPNNQHSLEPFRCVDLLSLLLFSNLLVFHEAIGREVHGSPQVYPNVLILQLTHNACAMNQVSTAENTTWPIHSNHIIPLLLTGAFKNERQHIMTGKSQVTCITGSTSPCMKNVYITASMGSISERRHLLFSTLQHALVNQGNHYSSAGGAVGWGSGGRVPMEGMFW